MKGTRFMRIYEIYDEENSLDIGVLLYYEKNKSCIIELRDELDEWTAPLLFTGLVKRDIYTIPRDAAMMWVRERVIPSGRQNIGDILSAHRLKEYDEMKLLELAEGRCSHDGMVISRMDSLPQFVQKRSERNLRDCTALDDRKLLCFFKDGTVKRLALPDLEDYQGVEKVIANRDLYETCTVGCGGYYVTFNDSIDIPAWLLHEKGKPVDVSYEDFITFTKKNVVDTTKACDLLECTRQNLSYLVKQRDITPVITGVKGNLYVKRDIVNGETLL